MMVSPRFGRLPKGTRDLLPADARRKRQLEQSFLELVEKWGYQEVVTPTFEYFENLSSLDSADDKLYKFIDRNGHLLALRPDITRPIARLVATRMCQAELPLRLYYLAHAYNYEDNLSGRMHEIYQAGVELLGASGPAADGEVVALAINALQTFALQDFRFSIGHVGIFSGLMEELQLSCEHVQAIKTAIGKKDFVRLSELMAAREIAPEIQSKITKLVSLRGGPEVLAQAADILNGSKALDALTNLAKVYRTLECYGVEKQVTIDLGLLLGLDYYTGLIFEGYTLGLGFPVCGGGRYDRLLGNFGCDLPATGFALSIDQILTAIEKQQGPAEEPAVDVLVAWAEGNLPLAVQKCMQLRAESLKVQLDVEAKTKEKAEEYANKKGIGKVIYVNEK